MERNYFKANPQHGCALANPAQCQSASNPPPGSSCPSVADPSFAPPLPVNFTHWATRLSRRLLWTSTVLRRGGPCRMHTGLLRPPERGRLRGDQGDVHTLRHLGGSLAIPRVCHRPPRRPRTDRCTLSPRAHHSACALGIRSGGATRHTPCGPGSSCVPVFAAALWPSVPYIVPQHEGLAYGVVTALQNAGLGGFPLLLSAVYGAAGQHYIPYTEMLSIGFAAVGFCAGIGLQLYDTAHGRVLNMQHLHVKPTMGEGETAPTHAPQDEQSRPGTSALLD